VNEILISLKSHQLVDAIEEVLRVLREELVMT
jgi:hypothetical protein